MQRFTPIAVFATVTAGAVPASAGDVTATSRIASVEVYPSAATVTRIADVSFESGESVIVVPHLPVATDTESVRVEGLATEGLEIVSVDIREVEPKPFDRPTDIEKRIKELRDKHAAVEDRIATSSEQLRFIANLVSEAPKQLYSRKAEQPMPNWTEMLAQFGGSMATLRDTVRAEKRAAREIADEIARLEDEQGRTWPEQKPTLEARIAVAAATAGNATLALRYSTPAASWRPIYDARLTLDGEAPALDIVRRAVISQSSGEDWTDTELTLSTAKPGGRATAPTLRPLILRIAPPPRPVVRKSMRRTPGRAESEAVAAAPMEELAAAAEPVAERGAELETRGFDLVYKIPGRASVSGDGRDKTLKIGTDAIAPKVVVKAVPELDTTAYLAVRFENGSPGPILPGRVQLFRDGVFVGKSRVAFVAPKEEVEFGFGEDPAVVVERITLSRSEGERGILSTSKTDERRYRITVTNRHKRPIDIEIEDRLPRSENEKIVVEALPSMTEPTTTDPDGRRGIVVWADRYAPNEKRDIEFGYSVRWPDGENVIWSDRPYR